MAGKSNTESKSITHRNGRKNGNHSHKSKHVIEDDARDENVLIQVKKSKSSDTKADCKSKNKFWCKCNDLFHRIAVRTANSMGSPISFLVAITIVLVWGISGPIFGFSDTWQLVINTGTTIVTFLMVFLIQNSQNRDSRAIHLKLDELLRAIGPARNQIIDLENCTDEEIDRLQDEFKKFRNRQNDDSQS